MLNELFQKIIELSKIPMFAQNTTEDKVIFAALILAIIFASVVVIKVAAVFFKFVWERTCTAIENVNRENAETKREAIRNPQQSAGPGY